MKQLILLLLLFCCCFSYAQDWEYESPDYEQIEEAIQQKNSHLFYESLMDRFLAADSTMTLEEKRHLYYGYSFHEEYSPYATSDYNDSLKVIFQQEELDSLDYQKIIVFTDSMLLGNPFDINALEYQLFSAEQSQNLELFEKRMNQLSAIVDAVLSSGTGVSKKEAFYVINVSHEYNILDMLGLPYGGSQHLTEHYDYLSLGENNANLEGLYFDVSRCLSTLPGMLSD